MDGERSSRLIDAIYDAAADPAKWEQALILLRDHLGGTNAAVTIMDTSPLKLGSRVSVGIDPQYVTSYASYYASKNPIWVRAPVCRPGTVLTNWMVMDTADVTKTEFYNDWVRPQRFHATLACYVLKEGATSGVVSVARGAGKGEFERGEVEAFAHTIAPHLRRAAQMQVRLMRAEFQSAGSAEAMDRLADAIILLGAGGHVLHTNRAAQELLREGDGLQLGRDGLLAAHNGDATALRRLVADAVDNNGAMSGADGVLAIRRPAPLPPLTMVVVPIRAELAWPSLAQPRCAVFVTDPSRLPQPDLAALRKLYGLSQAEAAVALAVCRGQGLAAASAAVGIHLSTTRTHLQRVFEKTGTRRQAELARLLLVAWPRVGPS
jgi:DNA-binding CsgD family transcriptional regulator/PAS domain-containing protein